MQTENRIELYDEARGILIMLVIFGHIVWMVSGKWISMLNIPIYSFHMPLFFILSGFTLKKTSKKMSAIIAKRAKRLLIPMAVFGVLLFLFGILLAYTIKGQNTEEVFETFNSEFWVRSLLCMYGGMFGKYWFFMAMFVTGVICIPVVQYVESEKAKLAIGVVTGIIATVYWAVSKQPLPFYINVGVLCSTFVMIGHYFRNESTLKGMLINHKMVMLSCIIFCIGNLIEERLGLGAVGLDEMDMKQPVLFWTVSLAGSLLCLAFCNRFVHNKFISSLGRNSLYMYGIHYFLLNLFDAAFHVKENEWSFPVKILVFIIFYAFVLFGTYAVMNGYLHIKRQLLECGKA